VHTYETDLRWAGSTGVGYDHYDRAHSLHAPPASASLELASDPAFGGRAERLNPEQLIVAAASSCQLLSFLAVAARARLDVVAYLDHATAVMPGDDPPTRITHIELHPEITLVDTDRRRPDDDRLHHLVQVAHRECYVANSLRSEVVVSAAFAWQEGRVDRTRHP